ncbi:NAD(P)-dependent oxidoreductase [Paenibacillus turpanensis]|uniref:NAD(P)-dependent oxidoreductase n=1 Tax=Paenibacillus turpanensis TaxID=2689078 RepID=UPI0014075826
MTTIIIVHSIEERLAAALKQAAPSCQFYYGKDPENWLGHLGDAEIVVGWNKQVQERVLQPGTKLRWLQSWSAGVDKLPVRELADKGITVTTASGVHPYPIAEHAFGMMLSLTRKLHLSMQNQLQRSWKHTGMLGELHGKTIGILGLGAIGEEIAHIARAFRMRVLGVRRSGAASPAADETYNVDQLNEVLGRSDYIVNCLPGTSGTTGLIGREQLQAIKPGAYFINVGRGTTVDTDALMEALQDGRLAGAGLDVVAPEPLPEEHPLWTMPNVIITPHNSGTTEYYHERVIDIFKRNLLAYLDRGAPDMNVYDPAKGY